MSSFDKAVDGIPSASQGARAEGFPHSPWELLEHMRLAQDDIVEFCTNAAYQHTKAWPGDYWPEDRRAADGHRVGRQRRGIRPGS